MSFGDDCAESELVPDPDPRTAWIAFVELVRQRLDAGQAAHGDRSLRRPPGEFVQELQQEALELAGRGFVLWCRLEAMRLEPATIIERCRNWPRR